jgi:hypothetical protein
MKKLGILVSFAFAIINFAFADDAPVVEVSNGSGSVDITLSSEGNGAWGIQSPATYQVGTATLTVNSLTIDPDPSISYAFSASNNPNAADNSTTQWNMSFPAAPLAVNLTPGLYNVSSSAAGSLTDGTTDGGTDGVTISPINLAPIVQSYIGGADAGVDLFYSAINSPAQALSSPFGPSTASGTYNLGTTATTMDVTLGFNLSGNDQASLTGRFNVSAVPEPASLPLAFIAAGAFVVLMVRRSRSPRVS